ncbi:transcription elongation factor [Vibrio sp. HA2012]|uniref:GreA/GreB family elongation factor n=1 Tax=Vibrio sp. HA2012 TaxID=1971595 RepID=UPI000C2C8159|nr:GreA/GreB family elongation factor [Vibrio sp. HA2012]PJC87319.1 transcription elongation factor [Vibrio sp. HA2012]
MDKSQLKQTILEQLYAIHKVAISATQRAIDTATDEETIPEHKYDTLALEASYLAHGQAIRVQECEEDIRQYQALIVNDFEEGSKISLGALVKLIDDGDREKYFFLGPCAGGVTFSFDIIEVTIVTPKAPLGQAMLGKQVGDEVCLSIGSKTICYDVDLII